MTALHLVEDSPHAALEALALRVREHVLRMATRGGCFVGASLSCADILVHLYARGARITPATVDDRDRDYVFLSKGHDVPALYAVLAELDFFPVARLANHLSPNDFLYWHPSRAVPGVEFHSGSLGHLLSVAMGVALDVQLAGGQNRVFVILGDGELNEGSVWEGFLVASALSLGNLVVVIDRNGFQANARTESLLPLEPLAQKLMSFGLGVRTFSGHDFAALDDGFARLPVASGRPAALICETHRGQGVPSLVDRADRWFASFTAEEVEALVDELHGRRRAELRSPPVMVR